MTKPQLPTVAVFNTSIDYLNILRLMLNAEGYAVATILISDIKSGDVDVIEFVQKYDPKVIVYDIAFPYRENWKQCQNVMQLQICHGRTFVLTTPNLDALERLVEERVGAQEVVDRDIDVRHIVDEVNKAWNASQADRNRSQK